MNSIRRLTVLAHLNNYTGYGEVVCQLFKHLSRRGVFVSMRQIALDEQWGRASAIPAEMRGQIVNSRQPEEWELLISPPNNSPTPGRKTIWFTMYESTEIPPQYVQLLNRAELVIVPCHWCAESFIASGVTAEVAVVPLGYDPEIFTPTPMRASGPAVFGVAGRTRHCAARKGVQEAIDLFLKTFPNESDVRLHVKVHPDDEVKANDWRVKITKTHFEAYEIAQWLAGLTAYMTLSRAEGFGLWPLQAMACGRPVIGAKYSGQADFLNEANAFIVPHRVVDAVSGESNVQYLGQWSELNYKVAAQHMQTIRKDRALAHQMAECGQKWTAPWTWEAAADKLIAQLERMGAL